MASVVAALLCVAALMVPQEASAFFKDPDPNWQEGEYTLPPAPVEASLRRVAVSAASSNTFLIDEASLSVGEDGVVRYVLVVRTPGGAENVTFEGIRCAPRAGRIYATGRADGQWAPTRTSEWQVIIASTYNRPQAALANDYFCDGPVPPRNRAEAVRKLRTERGVFR